MQLLLLDVEHFISDLFSYLDYVHNETFFAFVKLLAYFQR
jgi:hypothetical protein